MEIPRRVGRYEVELLLGEGGAWRVFLARDPVLGRQIALKVLRNDLGRTRAQYEERRERLREDVRAASTLSHPAMVALHDMGDDAAVGLYLVLELVRGPTLRERLHEGPLPPAEVAQMARALGGALAYAHGAGLVHRGMKPENVMLAPSGPKLGDFAVSPFDPNAPAYAAPEVLAAGTFGPSADQFSMAATMYEALTGRRAFPGDDPAAIAARVASGKHAPPRSAVPGLRGRLRLDAVFARALAKDPRKRFPSCDAFGSALAAELDGPRVAFLATPTPTRSSFAQATRRWQNVIALGAVAVIFALLLFGRFHPAGGGGGQTPVDRPEGSAHRILPQSSPRPMTQFAVPSASAAASPSVAMSALSAAASRVDP
jgi:serine/threonine protein kinase